MTALIWRVDPKPTGSYRSFIQRGWPSAAHAASDNPAVSIRSESRYVPQNVKSGRHEPLHVFIAVPLGNTFDWRRLKAGPFATLHDAKQAAQGHFTSHPEHIW